MKKTNAGTLKNTSDKVKKKFSPTKSTNANTFADTAAKVKTKSSPAEPTLKVIESKGGSAEDVKANKYAQAYIIPAIDKLINQHKDGSGIPKKEIEDTYSKIMDQMVKDGYMTKEALEKYKAPIMLESIEKVQVGTKMVEKNAEDKGLLNKLGNFIKGKGSEMIEVSLYEKQKVDKPGPSQFQKDIESSFAFNKQDEIASPNLTSRKDKLMNGLSKVCDSLGLKNLAKSCRQSISKGNLDKIYSAEKGMSELYSKVVTQAKEIGSSIKSGNKETDPKLAEQVQTQLAKRQQSGHGR